MKGLYKLLPPFASDYSGVCSTLFELGGFVVILDGGGCSVNFTGYDEPRWYGSTCTFFSSELREIDAVLGDDEKLLRKLENAIQIKKRQFVAIIGTPSPMVIGTDYEALARILSRKMNLPVLTFDTKGMDYYDIGVSMALLEIAQRFVKPASSRIESGVNIIGATPLDMGNSRHIKKLAALLTHAGCSILSCWAMGSTLDDIAQSAQAGLNIVVSHAGLEAARYMEREYGIPYFAGVPIGHGPTAEFIGKICSLLDLDSKSKPIPHAEEHLSDGNGKTALVLGEQLMSNAIRNCLRADMGIAEVDVASFFGMVENISEQNDSCLTEESDLTDLIDKHHYDVVVGDPLYSDLTASSGNSRFIAFPHFAVSSRIHWDSDIDYIGKEGARYFERELKDWLK
ncbi:MAG: nitrogenase component 1 [Desulfobacteraceae bacterium]|jgi:nitrogenase molybdenum-iron protein alpha/beta subunit